MFLFESFSFISLVSILELILDKWNNDLCIYALAYCAVHVSARQKRKLMFIKFIIITVNAFLTVNSSLH